MIKDLNETSSLLTPKSDMTHDKPLEIRHDPAAGQNYNEYEQAIGSKTMVQLNKANTSPMSVMSQEESAID